MSSIDLAGDAPFSTLNIRRRGQTAPKVESGAFRLPCRRLAQRAGLAAGQAQQRPGPSGAAGTRAAAPEPAGSGSRSGRGDRGCGCRRRGADLRPGRSRPPCRADLFGFHPNRTGDDLACDHRRTGPVVAGPVVHGRAAGASLDDRSGCRETQRAHRGRAGSELLVDRPGGGDATRRTHPHRPRGDEILAGAHRREHLTSGQAGRPEPSVRRPDSSSSSDVDRDVRSVTRCLAEI
jgi:hypothetical protein